jgi:hypothetical protein
MLLHECVICNALKLVCLCMLLHKCVVCNVLKLVCLCMLLHKCVVSNVQSDSQVALPDGWKDAAREAADR